MLIELRSTPSTTAPFFYSSTSEVFRESLFVFNSNGLYQLNEIDPDDFYEEDNDPLSGNGLDDLFGESDLYDEDNDDDYFEEDDDDDYYEDEYETEEYKEFEDEYKDEYDGGYGDDADGYHQEIDFGSDALGLDRIDDEEDEDDDDYF